MLKLSRAHAAPFEIKNQRKQKLRRLVGAHETKKTDEMSVFYSVWSQVYF
jgi:hypothetical protein